eukprot:5654186-Prymnesium_polylepis.1
MAAIEEATPTAADGDADGAGGLAVRSDPYKLPHVLSTAELTGWLQKAQIHTDKRGRWPAGEGWQRRWFALNGGTLYWFGGYFSTKGSVVLTAGARLHTHAVTKDTPYQLTVDTPELERAGLTLHLRAPNVDDFRKWHAALEAALKAAVAEERRSGGADKRAAAGDWLRRLGGMAPSRASR